MFWLGLIVAILSGLAGVGISRESLKRKYPRIRDLQIDRISVGLLFIGLLISTIDYRDATEELESARKDSRAAQERADEAIAKQQPRRFLPEQRSKLLELLNQGPKGPVIVQADWTDAEAGRYAAEIRGILDESGFEIRNITLQALASGQQGAFMLVKNLNSPPRHAISLQKSFDANHVRLNAFKVSGGMDRGIIEGSKENWEYDSDTVTIWVGQKP